jgi:hypothetical protein
MDSEEEGNVAGTQRSGITIICGTGSNATRYVSRPGEAFRVSTKFGKNDLPLREDSADSVP